MDKLDIALLIVLLFIIGMVCIGEHRNMRKAAFDIQSEEEVSQADKLEIWGSSSSDPAPDFIEYRLVKTISSKRVDGI